MPQVKSKINPPAGGQKPVKGARGPAALVSQVRPRSASKPAAVDARDPSSASPLAPRSGRKKVGGLSIPVYSLTGRSAGTMSLPKEIFGIEVNKSLLAQALRVYLNNQKTHWASTKTRSEVTASKRKIWSQKGTGRARHGAISAPIFVGGGVALGPKPRKVILDLPKKMKKKALTSALAQKMKDQEIVGVTGLDKATGKTKEMIQLLTKLNQKKVSALIVTGDRTQKATQAIRNISNVDLLPADQLNVFEVLKHQSLILTKEAVEKLEERFK